MTTPARSASSTPGASTTSGSRGTGRDPVIDDERGATEKLERDRRSAARRREDHQVVSGHLGELPRPRASRLGALATAESSANGGRWVGGAMLLPRRVGRRYLRRGARKGRSATCHC